LFRLTETDLLELEAKALDGSLVDCFLIIFQVERKANVFVFGLCLSSVYTTNGRAFLDGLPTYDLSLEDL
jgi:hypothetical protein